LASRQAGGHLQMGPICRKPKIENLNGNWLVIGS
jgi:hypothetical protein